MEAYYPDEDILVSDCACGYRFEIAHVTTTARFTQRCPECGTLYVCVHRIKAVRRYGEYGEEGLINGYYLMRIGRKMGDAPGQE